MPSTNQASNPIVKRVIALSAGGALAALAYLVPLEEGVSYKAYRDPIGIPTICEGFTTGVKMGDTATPAQCAAMVRPRLEQEVSFVTRAVTGVPMTPTRQVALADFVYNVGETTFNRSSVKRKLNAGDLAGGCEALTLYVYAGKTYLPGLASRRQIEKELCLYEPRK
jgi:lysozyme